MPFLNVLKNIIDSEEPEIIGWDTKGWFEIRDVSAFKTKVLPKYFKHNNFNSFAKQLNNYYFIKELKSENIFRYKNYYFPEKMKFIRRRNDTRKDCRMDDFHNCKIDVKILEENIDENIVHMEYLQIENIQFDNFEVSLEPIINLRLMSNTQELCKSNIEGYCLCFLHNGICINK